MTTMRTDHAITTYRHRHPVRTVLVAGADGLRAVPIRGRDRLRARLRAGALDRRLADGVAPETDRTLAVRAATICGADFRHRLAGHWDGLVDRAHAPAALGAHVPVRRAAVQAAAGEIHALATALRDAPLAPPAAIALALAVLTDGAGPVYRARPGARPGSSGDLREIVARLVELTAAHG